MNADFRDRLQQIVEGVVPELRERAREDIEHVLGIGVESVDALFSALENEHTDPETRKILCWVAARLEDERATLPLIRLLSHSDEELREEAARSLGQIGGVKAVEPLIDALLLDRVADVRCAAAYALGLIGDTRAMTPLIQILSDRSEAPAVRGFAAEALADLEEPAAVKPLVDALSDASQEVRFWATFALGEISTVEALPELERVAASDEGILPGYGLVRDKAKEAIERINERTRGT